MSADGASGYAAETAARLTEKEYRLFAAPALKVAAEVAASRGDPDLYNDMASMLALMVMVSTLTQAYLSCRGQFPAASTVETLEAGPMTVCALVFTRSALGPAEVKNCLQALSAAYQMLLQEGVLGPQNAYVEKAFVELRAKRLAAAHRLLLQAAHAMVKAVDDWEKRRNAAVWVPKDG